MDPQPTESSGQLNGISHRLNGLEPLGDFRFESQQDTNQNPKQIAQAKINKKNLKKKKKKKNP